MSEVCSHACGGRCCSDFVINRSPADLGRIYVDASARILAGETPWHSNDWEDVYIAEMIIRIDEDDEARARYTCKHFLPDVGLCGAYDRRPSMCSRFPYGRVCDYGCGYQNELPQLLTLKRQDP